MINERNISEKFSGLWKQNFPLLNSNFIRVFNDTQIKAINSNAIENNENVRYDLVSEMAFNLAEIVKNNKIIPSVFLSDEHNNSELIKRTAKAIWAVGKYTEDDLVITIDEQREILKITNNITEFISKIQIESTLFKPQLKGYGFIPSLEADLSIDDTLFEIKTVNRNFKSNDLKQLFIYLALGQVSQPEKWKYAGLYNPRKGTFCKFNIKEFVFNLTGGKSPNEAFENLLNGLVRDIEIDSKF